MRMDHTKDFLLDIRKAVDAVLKSGLDIEAIYLFGSYAYGEPNEASDIDLYVVLSDDSKSQIRAIDAMEKIGMEIFKSDVYNVEILAGFADDFLSRTSLPTIEKTISDKGVVLYERSA
ncbi:Nucleotidyltransferase domain-containing protein [Dethiosulfovibrio salsuginis]|uniref:Nucleotidyltransferase domain-containing protein n=2 Tax=Dethiosulfovibrio salsuginis TaxID=561720 RepID=A0A1X7JQ57_9BACT|nr:Nucleotidyltransferase domain-containing protein [Dethiosulfovibrio salsuginis]